MDTNLRTFVWQTILAMDKPFCLVDLYSYLEKHNITDRELILQVLDQMYDAGLINFHKLEGVVDDDTGEDIWGFTVAA